MIPPARPSQPLRRPLIGLALAFVAGTWGAVMIGNLPPAAAGALSAGLLIFAFLCQAGVSLYRRRQSMGSIGVSAFAVPSRLLPGLITLCLYLAVGAGAWCVAGLKLDDPFPNALAALLEKPRESVEVEGVVAAEPVVRRLAGGVRVLVDFPLRLEAIRRVNPWQKARGTIQITWPVLAGGAYPRYGERWRLAGVLTDNARFPEPELFADTTPQSKIGNLISKIGYPVTNASRPVLDWIKRRYTFWADPAAAACLVPSQGSSLVAACFQMRRKCAATLALGIEHRPEVTGLLQALLLGYRRELPQKPRGDFSLTGTYHIFAISGQHVAILALFIVVLLQSYRISRLRWFWYVAPILAAFTVATGMSASAVRGCLMALLCFLGPLLGRKPDIPSAIALAALIIMGVDPFQLFDYGFLLSFVAVTGLIVMCPPLIERLTPILAADPLRLQPEPRLVRLGRQFIRVVIFLFITSWAAWLATTPLIARWFNLVSPIALLANLIVIPVATLVLLASCLAIVCGLVLPALAEVFNFANVALVSLLLWITDLMARVPYGHAYVRSPPLWSLAVWYGTLLAWVAWRQRIVFGIRRIWLAGPIILFLVLGAGRLGSWKTATMDLLNYGDQPVCFINIPGAGDWLIDTGGRYQARKLIRHLRRQGVDRLQAVILTGADSSRAGGLPELLQAMPIRELWLPPGAEKSRALRGMLEIARNRGVRLRYWTENSLSTAPQSVHINIEPGMFYPTLPVALEFHLSGVAQHAAPTWLLSRGTVALLFIDGGPDSCAAAIRDAHPDFSPKVLIENRMADEHEHKRWGAEDGRPAWRIICVRDLCAGGDSDSQPCDRDLRLVPGQGMRIRLDRSLVRMERLAL